VDLVPTGDLDCFDVAFEFKGGAHLGEGGISNQ
jgi:hypothetical protein